MDILLDLGADSSFIKQFILVVVMFFLTKKLFLSHLQNIIETREEKTVKSLSDNNSKEQEVEKLSKQYHDELAGSLRKIRTKTEDEKAVLAKDFDKKYHVEEQKINEEVLTARKKSEEELAKKKSEVLSGADSLSSELLGKLVGGKQ